MKYIDKLLLILFPFMEVGFTLFGMPFRLGELAFFLFFFRFLFIDLRTKKLNLYGLIIIILLFVNLMTTSIVTYFSEVDNVFYSKYILRHILYLLGVVAFVLKPIEYDKIKVRSYIRYILYITFVFYLIEYIDYYIISFNWGDFIFVSRQEKSTFNDFLIRFSGQSSEPAYIIPLLSIVLMYGFQTRRVKLILFSLFFMLLTFSSFGYLVIVLAIFYFLNSSVDKDLKRKVKKIFIGVFSVSCVLGLVFINRVSEIMAYNWVKFQAYFGIGQAYEWSAAQRSGHIRLAFDLFSDSSWIRMLFGNGTGYYSKMSKVFTEFYLDDAEEAHSLYISTLTDRGLLGLGILILLFYVISKIKIPKEVSGEYKYFFIAIKFGALIRMLHWFFTGMLWQYYFWVEVVLLISASVYYMKVNNERQ